MRLSKRCEYGLRALIDLGIAREAGRPLLPIAELARLEGLPVKFLEQILLQLKSAGHVGSKRGKAGGYFLRGAMDRVRMGDLVRLMNGPLAPIACVSRTGYRRCSCPDEEHCGLRLLMLDVHNAAADVLDRFTLRDVVQVSIRQRERRRAPIPFAAR